MRKIIVFLILVLMLVTTTTFSQGQAEEEKVKIKRSITDFKRAYAYMEEELLISESDLYCSYFISNKMDEDLVIVGSENMDIFVNAYSDGAKMFINKGSNVGINEGDIFLILAKGKKVSNALTSKKLGTYYLKKSLAEVTCPYEDRAIVTLKKGCYPVYIGDILIPFKKQQTVFKKKINYKRCYLPQASSAIEGNVVYSNLYMDIGRGVSGSGDLLSIDLGKAMVSTGTFVLFYKLFKRDLPPLIIGSGIVINPQNTNSTVKVLDASQPLEVGAKLVVLPESKEQIRPIDAKDEDIPIIEFESQSLWFLIPYEFQKELEMEGYDLGGTVHAVEHGMIAMAPALAQISRWDLGGLSIDFDPVKQQPIIYIYDAYRGGIGIAESLYNSLTDLLVLTHMLIDSCSCDAPNGCPACIMSPKCGNNNEPLDKNGALFLLKKLLDIHK